MIPAWLQHLRAPSQGRVDMNDIARILCEADTAVSLGERTPRHIPAAWQSHDAEGNVTRHDPVPCRWHTLMAEHVAARLP